MPLPFPFKGKEPYLPRYSIFAPICLSPSTNSPIGLSNILPSPFIITSLFINAKSPVKNLLVVPAMPQNNSVFSFILKLPPLPKTIKSLFCFSNLIPSFSKDCIIYIVSSLYKGLCNTVFPLAKLAIIKALLVHTGRVFKELQPLTVNHGMAGIANTRQSDFLSRLASEFKRQDYLDVAKTMNISDATAERYIKALCDSGVLQRTAPGKFRKTE